MKKTPLHDPDVPDVDNNGQTLSVNGVRKLIDTRLENKLLEEAKDLWLLSFVLMGIDVKELLTAKRDEIYPGIFLAHKDRETTVPMPAYDVANDILDKYPGKIYAMGFIEREGIPSLNEARRRATRMRFELNRKMGIVSKFLKFTCAVPFENVRLNWMLLAKKHKMDSRIIGIMADFTANPNGRASLNGNLERIASENDAFMDFVYGMEKPEQEAFKYPVDMGGGSILLYRD